jgi:hypothetical protein
MNARLWKHVTTLIPTLTPLACVSIVVACANAIDDPTAPGAAAAALDQPGDAGVSDAPCGAGDDFFRCRDDDDCVAVRELFDCCNNGWKIAVNRDEAADYIAATDCRPHICPMYVINDTRVPVCDAQAHRCQMVAAPSQGQPSPAQP